MQTVEIRVKIDLDFDRSLQNALALEATHLGVRRVKLSEYVRAAVQAAMNETFRKTR